MVISPDVLVARSEKPAHESARRKLSLYSGVAEDAIALLPNAQTIYDVPLTLEDSGITNAIVRQLDLPTHKPDLKLWRDVVKRAMTKYDRTVTVGIVAKYLDNADTYLSVFEALRSAAWWNDVNVDIKWVDASALGEVDDIATELSKYDGIVVPGGFGSRGVDGKVRAAQHALKSKMPYLGLCYGLHMAVIAAARTNGLRTANTTEVDPTTSYPVISTMEDQKGKENTGGTMRLGDYDCELVKSSLAAKVYGSSKIVERHRHRYECNPEYVGKYEDWGIRAVGTNPLTGLVEVIEGVDHPFFLASQFHPEFKSRPTRPHAMFDGFIKALL